MTTTNFKFNNNNNNNNFFFILCIIYYYSWIGPVVVGAISQSTSNVWMGWPFVLALFVVATIIVLFIDVDAAKQELVDYEKSINSTIVATKSVTSVNEKIEP